MNGFSDERLINKFSLILEFNERSPLFARVANSELSKGNLNEALLLLEKGISVHPNYPTAHIIYGIALVKNGDIPKGIENINYGAKLIGSDETLNHYLKVIEKYFPEDLEISSNASSDVGEDEADDDKSFDLNEENFEERILGKDHIVSETLAGIYLSQDNLVEALAMYSKLAKVNPEKNEYFQKKVDVIREMLSKKKR